MKTTLRISILFVAFLGIAAQMRAQSTAFTYHGILNRNRAPVTGEYDMRFTVYDVENGGAAVAGPLPKNAVGVTNGLFAVRIDFLGGVFTGPPRWLEVSVRRTGDANFETLSPRQELTSSPYSIRAQSAGTAADVSNGAVVKSLNNLRDNITLAAGTNVTLVPNGNTLTIASAGAGGSGIWSVNGNKTYYNAGSVGIGTASPSGALQLASGGLAITGATSPYTGAGAGVFMESLASGGALFAFDYSSFLPRPLLLNSPGGNVGIGTTTPAHKLTINYPGFGLEHMGGNVRLGTYVSEDGLSSDGGWLGTISNHKLHFYVNNGQPSVTINTFGDVGIGTTTPQERLTIANVFGPGSGLKITGVGAAGVGMAIENLFSGGHKWDLVSGGYEPLIPSASGNFRIVDETVGATRLVIDPTGNVGIGILVNPQAKLDVQGTTRTRILTVTGGADLAEPFPFSSVSIAQGSVVIIDDEQPGKLKLSTSAYDTRVAGIVSGANGVNPGISLHQEGTLDGSQNVSLTGRVYVLADATTGSIKAGDLLTTSDTPGHAMKAADHSRAQGAILGKAMSGLADGKGMVLVLVTLQ
jgi:hypothetical protein